MTTSSTKTRALCVATRCTTIEQFVATFHRFCGDDQTFFVATMTSRPIGLETAFSIQLADKQPVLRGLCIVLDAWETPENRYRRPGIRLGIKRLTADSQVVFDRLKAASRSPVGIAEATPPPGPLPLPQITAGSHPPVTASRLTATPPPLPGLAPRTPVGIPPIRREPLPPRTAPGAASLPIASLPPVPPIAAASPPIASLPSTLPGVPSPAAPPVAAQADAEPPASPPASPPAPIEVTRFQVALKVGTTPPPVRDVEFKPQLLVPRRRRGSRIGSEPPPDDAPEDPGQPAMIVGRPSAPEVAERSGTLPGVVAADRASRTAEPAAADLRAPGSALVLPANPLHDLSDESLEGFVDCTLYEETENIFHPAVDGADWTEPGEPPAAPVSQRPATVPAMPFDTTPDVMLRTLGGTESLAVSPDGAPRSATGSWTASGELVSGSSEPAMAAARSMPRLVTPLPRPATGAPLEPLGSGPDPASWFDSVSLPHSAAGPDDPASADPRRAASAASGPGMLGDPATAMHRPSTDPAAMQGHLEAGAPGAVGYPAPQYRAAQLVALPAPPIAVAQPEWRRWLLIVGSVIVAIILAFSIARMVRGGDRGKRAASAGHTASAPPRPAPSPAAAPTGAAAPDHKEPGAAPTATGSLASDVAEPPEDDGEAAAGGAPIVGSGPCRFTVATTPAGSIIRLDDQAMGPSPVTIEGSCDRHKVDASHARYQSVTRWVTLTANKPQALDINLPRPVHAVTVTSFPPGAELSIDGHRAGTTPTVVQMMGFATVHLTFTKPGFQTVTKKVYSKLSQDRVFVKLLR